MDLSIIIVNWNSVQYLAKAIDSVLAQASAISFEIVVVDSGSYDGCGEMIRKSYPEVIFVQSASNVGFSRANNLGYRASCGGVLLFLNPDTEILGDAIGQLFRRLTELPQAAIAGPKLLNTDGSIQETCVRAFPTILNQFLDSDVLRRWFPRARLWGKQTLFVAGDAPRKVEAVSGACLMMRRSVFEAVGLFSTDYFMYAEDMDLCLKACRAGFDAYYVPAAVVVHHGGGSSSQAPASTFSAVMAMESQWRYFRKTRSGRYATLYRAAMGGASLLRLGALLLMGPAQALRRQNPWGRNAQGKWAARLRWALGGERWVRKY
jgi:hypothetical protein